MIGSRIKALLAEAGISQAELSRKIERPQYSISDWVKGRSEPDLATLRKIAAALSVPVSRLMEDESPADQRDEATEDAVFFNVIGEIPAGVPIEAVTEFVGQVPLPASILKGRRKRDIFCLLVRGDSMTPTILNGDVVAIHTKSRAEPHSVVAVRIDLEGDVTLKRWKPLDSGVIVLQPDNTSYSPMVFDPEKNDFAITILGRAIYVSRKL